MVEFFPAFWEFQTLPRTTYIIVQNQSRQLDRSLPLLWDTDSVGLEEGQALKQVLWSSQYFENQGCRPVFLQLWHVRESPAVLVKTQIITQPQAFWFSTFRWSLEICISNKSHPVKWGWCGDIFWDRSFLLQ